MTVLETRRILLFSEYFLQRVKKLVLIHVKSLNTNGHSMICYHHNIIYSLFNNLGESNKYTNTTESWSQHSPWGFWLLLKYAVFFLELQWHHLTLHDTSFTHRPWGCLPIIRRNIKLKKVEELQGKDFTRCTRKPLQKCIKWWFRGMIIPQLN